MAGLNVLKNITKSNAENQATVGAHVESIVGIVEEHRTNAEVTCRKYASVR